MENQNILEPVDLSAEVNATSHDGVEPHVDCANTLTSNNIRSANIAATSHGSIQLAMGLLLGKVLMQYGFSYEETAIVMAGAGAAMAWAISAFRKWRSNE
jgi:hypothetical protein